jgi:tagatose 6-phosphate kinase
VAEAREKGCRSYCDSYGDAFRQALRSRPTVVQCNRMELASTLGRSITTEGEIRDVLRGTIDSGIEMAVVTDGSRLAYAAARGRIWKIVPPAVEAVNPTGSGDCFAAGVLRDLERGRPFEEALKFGAAAGAANAGRWDVATVAEGEAEALARSVRIEEL